MRFAYILAATILLISCNSNKKQDTKETTGMTEEMAMPPVQTIDPDSVLFSFVFMGCNRVDLKDTANPNTNASTANIPELQRTFNEIAALNPKPVFYFFLGDQVLGLDKDTAVLTAQLRAWSRQYQDPSFSALPGAGIQMIAIPGNHEMLYETETKKGKKEEVPAKHGLAAWMNAMAAYMPAGVTINRVTGKDSLDNLMTYSFTWGNTHFILLNTDTYDKSGKIGMAPAAWIVADIKAARKDTAVKHIFLMGHKPALVTEPLYTPDGDKTMDVSVVQALWPEMNKHQVEAMLSAHSHQYDRIQPISGGPYQVIAGNGGSPYEHKAEKDTSRQFFGYTIVYVMKNGQVRLQSMGRSVGHKKYLETLPPGLCTTIRDTANITWGTTDSLWIPGLSLKPAACR
ncbi:MAG: metallophosphoesterase [Chitinophagaceae bacterium]|nr:metallophosphoesterase [Chitinophagaceae bacterium]